MRVRIAAAAARLMAQDGIDDFALAKRKAAKQLGASDTQALPGNEEIEEQLRAYQQLYQGDEQRERLQALREKALEVMRVLAEFRPYLTGQVLSGVAGRYGEIDLQVYTDDAKGLEILFLNRNIAYEVAEQRRHLNGETRSFSVLSLDWEGTRVNITVLGAKDERSSLKSAAGGKVLERASLPAVELLVATNG